MSAPETITTAYIASPYIRLADINQTIEDMLQESLGINVFRPASIAADPQTVEARLKVAEICYDVIDNSDIIIAVEPFGTSVAAEIGYAIHQMRSGQQKHLILFETKGQSRSQNEDMIIPYVDAVVSSIEELVDVVGQLISANENLPLEYVQENLRSVHRTKNLHRG